MKRYILSISDYEKWLYKIIRAVGNSRKYNCNWTKEFRRRDIRRFTVSGIHYLKKGIVSKNKVWGIATLWDDETGDNLAKLYPERPYS